MTTFAFDVTIKDERDIESSALGAGVGDTYASADHIGRLVKMGAAQNHVVTADGDPIEGVITSVEPATVNNGFSFGGVRRSGRISAIAPNAIALLATVVSAAQPVSGATFKASVKAGAGKWRVVRKFGNDTGGVGFTKVVIERSPL
jgi:hypothetical protein